MIMHEQDRPDTPRRRKGWQDVSNLLPAHGDHCQVVFVARRELVDNRNACHCVPLRDSVFEDYSLSSQVGKPGATSEQSDIMPGLEQSRAIERCLHTRAVDEIFHREFRVVESSNLSRLNISSANELRSPE